MSDIDSRIQRAAAELTGNESLLSMLETDAADAMLAWGINMSTAIVGGTNEMDDPAAEKWLMPRLKAVRSSMKAIGYWAVGKYSEGESRVQLRDTLLEQFRIMLGDDAILPAADELDALLSQVDDAENTPHQLVQKIIELIENIN